MITVHIDDLEVKVMLDDAPGRVQRAVVRALNRAIGSARTVMVHEIAKDTGLKSGDVRDALTLSKATIDRPTASLAAGLKRIPLIDFKAMDKAWNRGTGHRTGSGGVTYKLPGGAGRNPNAFIATMASGHRGVFKRRGASRLPIVELFGPSLGHVFIKYRPLGEARAQEAFLSNFEHELVFTGAEPVVAVSQDEA